MVKKKVGIFIYPGRKPWKHEMRVAEILALAGHYVEFLPESEIKTADILLDGVEYEIKSLESSRSISIERAIKKGLKQSRNLIIDSSRLKNGQDDKICRFLVSQMRIRKQIKKMLFINKNGQIFDITGMI